MRRRSARSDYLNLSFNITATDSDGDTATGKFIVAVDAAGTIGSIDYNNETTGVFVNLGGADATFGGQTVHGHSATDLSPAAAMSSASMRSAPSPMPPAARPTTSLSVSAVPASAPLTPLAAATPAGPAGGTVSTIHGNGGNDTIIYNIASGGTETVDGGTGTDTRSSTAPVRR